MADTVNEKIVPVLFEPVARPTQYGEREGYIYFAHDGNAIKIGFSFTPESRIRDLQTSSSRQIEMLWKIRGNLFQEQKLHRRFAHLNLQGEWFKDDVELRLFIDSFKPTHKKAKPNPLTQTDKEFIELAKVRPKIAQRRTNNRALINALKSYDLNRRTAAEAAAFEHVRVNA